MRPQEIIAKKRDGNVLTAEEIKLFIDGVCDSSWADYQITALIMAMFIRGLDNGEQDALVREMLYSGDVLDLADIDLPVADKHSTGGVGDKTSLIIAPLAAACGLAVPMISGRGLGHTGGTLDKLESIPDFNVNLTTEEFKVVLKKCGFAMAGQTAEIAPADKKIYALRDATATVPYIPLIVASIMSKKLAEDLDALVLDVKTGAGAFMQEFEDSRALAEALVKTGNGFGVKTEAVISDMSQPLGMYVGNALEVYECIKLLRGEAESQMQPTLDLSVELTARLLVMSGISDNLGAAKQRCGEALSSGVALEKFRQNVELQGGDPRVCDDPDTLLAKDLTKVEIQADSDGFIESFDALVVGEAICGIGGGRIMADDGIDHAVGYACNAGIGTKVSKGESVGTVYCRDRDKAATVVSKIKDAYTIADSAPEELNLVVDIVS
jgi:pyrimidine-nucleoside phosphorylase